MLIHNDHKRNKLDSEWLEPHRIKVAKTSYYEVEMEGQVKKIHGNRLKPYFSGRSPLQGTSHTNWK